MSLDDPSTSTALLRRLRDPLDQRAWEEFSRMYHGFWSRLLRGRISPSDQADVLQEILVELARVLPSYQHEPAKGRFRGWLHVVSRRILDKSLRRRGKVALAEDLGLDPMTVPEGIDPLEVKWTVELNQFIVRCALAKLYAEKLAQTGKEMNPHVRQLLDLMYVREMDDADAARKAGVAIQQVYDVRRRWEERVRWHVAEVVARLDDGTWLPWIAPTPESDAA